MKIQILLFKFHGLPCLLAIKFPLKVSNVTSVFGFPKLHKQIIVRWLLKAVIFNVNQQKSCGRCGGLMVSALDSKSSGSHSTSGCGHCAEILRAH